VQRQVRLLRELGIKDVTVIVNSINGQDLMPTLPLDVNTMCAHTPHKNAFIELQGMLPYIPENDSCLILLGDVVCSKKALAFMLSCEGDFLVYGLEHGNPELIKKAAIFGRPEVFAIKIKKTHLKQAKVKIASIEPKDVTPEAQNEAEKAFYDWWNIPKQLNIPITRLEEALNIDFKDDIPIIKEWLKTIE